MLRSVSDGVQLCKAQSLSKFARWLLITMGVVVVRARLTAGGELIDESRECLDTMFAAWMNKRCSAQRRTDRSGKTFRCSARLR